MIRTESRIELEEQQERMRQKLKAHAGSSMPSRPPPKSKAVRAPEEVKQEEPLTFEEEARLTTDQITRAVEDAKQAMNAPPTDLLAFEQALK